MLGLHLVGEWTDTKGPNGHLERIFKKQTLDSVKPRFKSLNCHPAGWPWASFSTTPSSGFPYVKSLQSCSALWNPMDCSLPGSSVHGIHQARILEWVAMPPPGDLSVPGLEPKSVKSNLLWQAGSLPLVPLLQQKGHLCDNSFQKRRRRLIKSRIRQWRNLSEGFFSLGTRRLLNPLRFPVKMSCKMIG